MKETYIIGARLKKFKYLSIAVNTALIFTFYFIYRFLFAPSFPDLVGTPLALLFLLLTLLTAALTVKAFDRYASSVSYQLTPEGLLEIRAKSTRLYLWQDFSGVSFRDGSFQNVFPVEFQVGQSTLMLNQHLDGLCRLTYEIFLRIQDHVPLPADLVEKTRQMIDVY